jgi:hypothetical protein
MKRRSEAAPQQVKALPAASIAVTSGQSITFANKRIGLLANEWAVAALILVVTRAFALFGAYLGASRLVASDPFRNKGWFAEMALNWDAAWYAKIVKSGYSWQPGAEGGTNIAFPPLYPLLLRVVSNVLEWITFGWDWGNREYGSLIAAGLLVSNVSFLVAMALLIRLLTPRLGRAGAAMVVLGVASLPLSFFFSALYTEGLFLLLVVGSLYVARSDWRAKWLAVGAIGMLAALLRFTGIVLLPVLLVEYFSQRGWGLAKVRTDVLWLGLIPLGLVIYMAFLWWRFGTPQALLDTQYKGWHHEASFFLRTYWDDGVVPLWKSVTGAVRPENDWVLLHGSGNRLYAFLDVLGPPVLLGGALAARKKLGPAEWTWLLLGILFPLSSNTTNSLARYLLPLWPGLVWLGMLRGGWRWVYVVWIGSSLALLAWCAGIYAGALWIG